MPRLLPVALFAAVVVSTGRGQPPPDPDQMLRGEWVVVKAERNEEPATLLRGARYNFDGKRLINSPADKALPPRVAGYRVLPPVVPGGPNRLVFTPEDGPKRGEELEGIFRFKDGTLEFCHGVVPRKMNGVVPTDFVTKKDTGIVLLTMKRIQKD